MDSHGKKMIAPVLIVAALIAYYAVAGFVLAILDVPAWMKAAGGILALAVSGMLVWVLIERVREIRKGEEDDLGKY